MPATENNERMANLLRELLADRPDVDERHIFSSIHFMVDDKMCIGVMGDELLCRIGTDEHARALEQHGCRPLIIGKKPAKNFILVHEEVLRSRKDFEHWVHLCLAFNPQAKASKKK